MSAQLKVGVDTGGTFTDFVWFDQNGRWHIHKQLSTPSDPAVAVLTGIESLAVPDTADVVHGSTVATNALLERRGARTALITTAGFADVLAIGRQNRPDIYALVPQKPPSLVPREWRFEVKERVTAQGEVLLPFDETDLPHILAQITADGIESVAICLLFSFLYPTHEQQIKAGIEAMSPTPLHLSLSSDILPEYREYERTATTVINAYVAPLMSRYLSRLAAEVQPRRLTVMQSNGGIIQAETASAQAVRTVLSGPAGGVVGARYVAQQAACPQIITFDMGGTSTDVALCPGRLPVTSNSEIAGLPVRLPVIDIHTVGAGGGSLASVDAGGALHVGPQSAGADPGPACYGKGGQQATTTDANLVLGRLDADHFLGGEMALDGAAAEKALADLAAQMGETAVETAAWGVIQVANAHMERAIRRVSVERGYDPRRFTLVPFGGAGPLHACELAENLQIPQVLIPAVPGVLSALGMLVAVPTKDYSQTVMHTIHPDDETVSTWLAEQFTPLVERSMAEMAQEGHDPGSLVQQYHVDMRYAGQSHELTVPYAVAAMSHSALVERFHEAHETRYGYRQPTAEIEMVTVRLTTIAPMQPPHLAPRPLTTADASSAIMGSKLVWFNQQRWSTALYDRQKLLPGHRFDGPAIVFQYDTTTVVPPGWQTAVDPFANLILTYNDEE